MTAKPTQGPWAVATVSHNDSIVLVGSNFDPSKEATKNGGMWIAQCLGPDREANARFIAGAPDLLFALEQLVSMAVIWERLDGRKNIQLGHSEAYQRARAVIASAKGNAP